MSRGAELALVASEFLGVPFKLYGRDPRIGLDCIGLLIATLSAMNIRAVGPSGYALRNCAIGPWLKHLTDAGFTKSMSQTQRGDVLIMSPSARQHHLMIASTNLSVVHAHAGLRRVVQQPLSNDAQVLGRWRLSD